METIKGAFVVTVSHLLGCGGAYIGEKLAQRWQVPFVDRDILRRVAKELNLAEDDIAHREERLSSFWQMFARAERLNSPFVDPSPDSFLTDRDLFELESRNIERIAKNSSAVILGRGGCYILREHPRHLRVFVCAEMPDRIKRVQGLYHTDEADAAKIIEKNDRERAAYIRTFTKRDLYDARCYDICVNTSTAGPDNAVGLICRLAAVKLGLPLAE